MKVSVESVFKQMSENEKSLLNKKLVQIRNRMDESSDIWFKLKTGESMILDW